MKVIYAFCKPGEEGQGWAEDITAACNENDSFIPFNYHDYLSYSRYIDARSLDSLYQSREPALLRMYEDIRGLTIGSKADAIVVCDAPPFHPDFLRTLPIYKVLYSQDDPEATYSRNIPYLHAYQHVFYATPAYTSDMGMDEKLASCGMVNRDLVPTATHFLDYDQNFDESDVFRKSRDIDVLFIGGFYWPKIDLLTRVAKSLGHNFRWYGHLKLKHNLYLSAKYRYPFLVRPVSFRRRIELHQRAKICLNVHNGYGVPNIGNQRLFYGCANGAMLLTDGVAHLPVFYKVDCEAVGYDGVDDALDKIMYYLAHAEEREQIARNGYRRVMRDYRFSDVISRCTTLIERGMNRIGWGPRSRAGCATAASSALLNLV